MLEDKIESILSDKEWFEETIIDTIYKFGNDQRLNQYRDRLNEIFINANEKSNQRSPLYSSSTESSSIKFSTSVDEDDNNGESMIVDDDEADKQDDMQGNENDEDTANNESKIREEVSVNNDGTCNIMDEAAGNKVVSSSKDDVVSENNDVSSRHKVHLIFLLLSIFCLSFTGDMRYHW